MLFPLILFILFLLSYCLFALAVWWHTREYTPPNDKYRWVTNIFLITIFIFIAISIAMFFMVPWSDLLDIY